jgi:8-amino-7-oxononanoate synthase
MEDDFLSKKLQMREEQHLLRSLKLPITNSMDFCSNDYLGIVTNKLISQNKNESASVILRSGSTGSRLLSGNYALIEEAEHQISGFHQAEAGLIFNSGYDANVGLISCVAQKNDLVIYDALSHASIRDGIRLSFAKSYSFLHNDIPDLEKKLETAKGEAVENIFVVTESVFSMDGDQAPLNEMVSLCKKYNANIIVDEAHATGLIGDKGEGLVQHLKLQEEIFARVHTFGKAVGVQGAIVLGSQQLKKYLINFSRALIYTTALPEWTIHHLLNSYAIFPKLNEERKKLTRMIDLFQGLSIQYKKLQSHTPIQGVIIPGNEEARNVARALQEKDFDIRAILYPSVPKGQERLRIVLHSFNTEEQIENLGRLLL